VEYMKLDDITDEEDEDLLELLESCIQFIHDALQDSDGPNKILVHCEAGQSRSVAVICGYLMKTLKWSLEDALGVVQAANPKAQPNDGFLQQLRLYESMGCALDDARPAYKYHKAQQLARKREREGWLDATLLQALPGTTGAGGGQDGEMFRCRKCRKIVGTHANVFPHLPGQGQAAFKYRKQTRDVPVGTECTSLFLEPLSWMNESGIAEGNVEGKLMCNGCSSRIGSFAWSGEQCSCGAWVTPAFQLHKAKLDIIRVLPAPKLSKPRVLATTPTSKNE